MGAKTVVVFSKVKLDPIPEDMDEAVDVTLKPEDAKDEGNTLDSLPRESPVKLNICFSTSIEVEALIFVIDAAAELVELALLFFLGAFFLPKLCPLEGTSPNVIEEEEGDFSRLVTLRFF